MAGKKGVTPKHIKQKQFIHPGIDHPAIQILEQIEDPRKPSLFLCYSSTSVLFMVLAAFLCGATDWPKVVAMAEGMIDWLANYVDMSSGVPCERTFKNLMNAIEPSSMEKALRELASLVREKKSKEVVSFDGQTEKGTADKYTGMKGIHLLSAWSSDNNICLGQIKVDDKSNEITATPELMDMLDLHGTIITADALNTQKTIAAKAIAKGGDYILPVKGNHSCLLQDIALAFDGIEIEQAREKMQWERAIGKAKENRDKARLQRLIEKGASACGAHTKNEIEKSRGRVEIRQCTAIQAKNLPSSEGWQKLRSLVRIKRERVEGEKKSCEIVYYISSLKAADVEIIGQSVRQHWGVEGLHWYLDVVFRQDKSRYRNRIGARNLAIIRKIALNALANETSFKGGIATKQCVACCNPTYREKLVKKLF